MPGGSAASGTGYGTHPASFPYAPAAAPGPDPAWQGATGYGERIAVGSMSTQQFKALPRKERVSKERPDLDLARGRNSLAYNGVLAGAISLVLSGLLVFAVAAIVWSVRGMHRARDFEAQGYPPLGRSQATTGLVLGIVGAVLGVLSILVRLGSM